MNANHKFRLTSMGAFLLLFVILSQLLTACGDALAVSTPTQGVQPTSTADPHNSIIVVQAFWDALAAGDKDLAMSYVGEKVTCAAFCHFTGRDLFDTFIQGYLNAGYLTKISDLKGIGSIVTYSWEVYRQGNFVRRGEEDEMMQVENGKIIYWENYHR